MKYIVLGLYAFLLSSSLHAAENPNIVVINVDDLGWTDVDYMPDQKPRFYTPNIQKLASQGMVFINSYAACPVCSPTRASLMTGKSPAALMLTAHIAGNPAVVAKKTPADAKYLPAKSLPHLPLTEVTFAEVLKKQGYQTCFIGKWHLAGEGSAKNRKLDGAVAPQYHPDKQGFDINIGGCAYGQPGGTYFDPHHNATIKDRKKGEYLTDRLADEAVNFISHYQNKKFLLYLNPYTVHTPIQAPQDRINLMKQKLGDNKNSKYAAMVYSLDLMVGKITGQLDQLGLTDSTLLIFTSDNGGHFSNEPLRDRKGTLYEGGIRVPHIVRWPRVVTAGSVSDEPVISYDLFPTLLAAAGCLDQCPEDVEGQDLGPILRDVNDGGFQRKSPLLWHYPHYHHGGAQSLDMGSAIRDGKWKYIHCFKSGENYLFNLKTDPAEQNNLVKNDPERAKALHKKLFHQLRSLNAHMPIKSSQESTEK
jgi:arylsulfatase A